MAPHLGQHGRAAERIVRRRRLLSWAVLAACLLSVPGSVQAVDYFVRSTGNDQADGLTAATAFASIHRAASAVLNPGDRVLVGPGRYEEGNIGLRVSGISSRPIVFRAAPELDSEEGATVIAPPAGITTGFLLVGRHDVIIDGFVVRGTADAGVQVRTSATRGESHDITVRNTQTVDGTRIGIDIVASGRVTIENCRVTGNRTAGIIVRDPCAGQEGCQAEALHVEVSGTSVLANGANGVDLAGISAARIEGNRIEDNGRSGLRLMQGQAAQVTDNIIQGNQEDGLDAENIAGLTISDNQSRSNGAQGVLLAAVTDVVLQNNTIFRNASSGITAQDATTLSAFDNRIGINGGQGLLLVTATDLLVQNNTIFSNTSSGVTVRDAQNVAVLNNLLYDNEGHGISLGTGAVGVTGMVLFQNTVYANARWGLIIGDRSPGALVVNNIIAANRGGGLAVHRVSTCAYVAGFNINQDGYSVSTPSNSYHFDVSPLFVAPSGVDGVLGGDGFDDDDFHLQANSPAVDGGSTTVGRMGLTGGTNADGQADRGKVDIGFHYGTDAVQLLSTPFPFMPLFVRKTGSDENSGLTPVDALRTLHAAAARAGAGVSIIVGPGRYDEADVAAPRNAGRVFFVADPFGECTHDLPGSVLLDASGGRTGFTLRDACASSVDGFHIRGSADAGVQVRFGADGSEVRNNVLFDNRRGIDVKGVDRVRVLNNLSYANGGGIQVEQENAVGGVGTIIENNTSYGNTFNGIVLDAATATAGTRLLYNILQGNGARGIEVVPDPVTACVAVTANFRSGYNVNVDGWGGCARRADADLIADPLLVDPDGPDGMLAGNGYADDAFQLSQRSAGQAADSPAVDLAPLTSADAGLADRSTRSDGLPDQDALDVGFHYPGLAAGSETAATTPPTGFPTTRLCAGPELAGDCNQDGLVTVNELILAVRIALGTGTLDDCSAADPNRDGRVTVDEIILAVDTALGAAG